MRNADSPYLTDLFAISLRWLVLFGLTISLGTGGAMISTQTSLISLPLIILTLPALWNGFVSALAIFNRRLPVHRMVNVALDVVFCLALFITAGGLGSGVFWVALLPLFSAAIYYEARGALLVAVLVSLLQAGYTFLVDSQIAQLLPIGVMAGFNLAAGVAVALLSHPLIGQLRRSYQSTVSQRRESERKAQVQEHDRMKALFSMIETFSSTLNYQTVLETVVSTAVDAIQATNSEREDMAAAVLLFGDRKELEIRASRGFLARDTSITLPGDEGALQKALEMGESYMIDLPEEDAELGKLSTMQRCKVALCLPMIRAMNAYGVMVFAHPEVKFFTQERVETLQMMTNQAVIAVQNARLYQALAEEKERIVQTQEEAQKKLARDLHDGPTQSVSALAMRANIVRKILEKSQGDPAVQEATAELVRIEDLARRTTQEIRHMLFTLRPLVLESEGLEAALKQMAEKMFDLYQQKVSIDVDMGVVMQLDMPRQGIIFSLAEESVNNARKHAQAHEILVRLKPAPQDDCIAVLEIVDNGQGFDVKSVLDSYDRRGSLGMVNLRERTELVNGILHIDSVPGKGTRIRILIPLTEEATDRLHKRR